MNDLNHLPSFQKIEKVRGSDTVFNFRIVIISRLFTFKEFFPTFSVLILF